MEDNNKYYVPEISDFHVGFNFEYRIRNRDGGILTLENGEELKSNEVSKEWIPCNDFSEFDYFDESGISRVLGLIKNGDVRVKYLDKQDIESCGWIEKIWDNNSGYFSIGNYTFGYHDSSHNNTLNCFAHISKTEGGFNVAIFNGKILNKSELLFFMKRLEIEKPESQTNNS